MPVFRIEKNKNYTVMSNFHLRDKRLSLKTIGLLSIILSLPEDWDYSIAGLCAIVKEGEGAVKTALEEMKSCGYLTIEKKLPNQTESGRIEYIYNIREYPKLSTENLDKSVNKSVDKSKQEGGFQPLVFQEVEFQEVENRGQINKDNQIKNNKIQSNNIIHDDERQEELEIFRKWMKERTGDSYWDNYGKE